MLDGLGSAWTSSPRTERMLNMNLNLLISEILKKIDNPNIVKAIIIGFVALYVIAPDAIPGPADDILVAVLGLLLDKKLTKATSAKEDAE